MTYIQKKIKYLFHSIKALYCNDLQFITRNKQQIALSNLTLLKRMTILYTVALFFCCFASIPLFHSALIARILSIFLILHVAFFILVLLYATQEHIKYRTVLILCYVFAFMIQTLVISVSVLGVSDYSGVLFFPLLICMAIIYILPVYTSTIIVFVCSGVFLMFSYFFKPTSIFSMDVFTSLVSIAIALSSAFIASSARVREDNAKSALRDLSAIDSLTGLTNKSTTQILCEHYLCTLSPFTPSALFIIDIDDYKQINDTFGHQVGDEFLKGYASLLVSIFLANNSDNILGRFGGDEFVVLIKNVTSVAVVEDYAATLCARTVEWSKEFIQMPVSCSVGISITADASTTYFRLFEHADQSLYKIKNSGKNNYHTSDIYNFSQQYDLLIPRKH